MSQIENSKRASLAVHFRDLEIRILDLFRISKFELRISKGKLDRFVNFGATKWTWSINLGKVLEPSLTVGLLTESLDASVGSPKVRGAYEANDFNRHLFASWLPRRELTSLF